MIGLSVSDSSELADSDGYGTLILAPEIQDKREKQADFLEG